ncbi:MAG: MFS transporter, partial [Porticoccaceae bacterium]|nr:MFS transporter [Porticoccaceae bacterium]
GWLLVALGGLGTAAGYLLASGSAALLEPVFSWRILWLLGLPTGLVLIFLNRYIPESPRFLQSLGLGDQALAVYRYYRSRFTRDAVPAVTSRPAKYTSTAFRDVFGGAYAPITIGLLGVGLSWGLVNFGFLLWLPNNLRETGMSAEAANGLLARSGLIALPGTLAVIWLYHKWSSIKSLVLFNLLTAASLAVFSAMNLLGVHSPHAVMLATALLLISASGVVAMLIPYAAEIYPVQIRGTGTGLVASSSKAGGIVGALLSMLGVFSDLSISAIIIMAPILGFTLLLFLSGVDTRGRTLEEINANLLLRTSDS